MRRCSAVFSWGRLGLRELFMQREHLLHQGDHAIVAGDVGGVGEIDGTDWEIFEVDVVSRQLSNVG